jgi:hypothetical protein
MRHAVYKYPILSAVSFTQFLPLGTKILSCAMQADIPVFWALVDLDATRQLPIHFLFVNTGTELGPGDMKYMRFVGTLTSSTWVRHFFTDGLA